MFEACSPYWLLLATTLAWGCWSICDKLALQSMHPALVQLINVGVGVVAVPFYYWLLKTSHSVPLPGLKNWMWAIAGSVLTWIATLACLYSLQHKDASLVIGFTASYPVVTLFIAMVFLGEPVSFARIFGIFLIMMGTFLITK